MYACMRVCVYVELQAVGRHSKMIGQGQNADGHESFQCRDAHMLHNPYIAIRRYVHTYVVHTHVRTT